MNDAVPAEQGKQPERVRDDAANEDSQPSIEIRAEHRSAELHFHAHGSTAEAIEALERIDSLDPDGMAVAMLQSMLDDSAHRRETDQTESRRRHTLAIRGQMGALLIALSGLTFGFVLAVLGRPLWGFGWTASVLVPIVGMSIAELRSERRRQGLQQLDDELAQRDGGEPTDEPN